MWEEKSHPILREELLIHVNSAELEYLWFANDQLAIRTRFIQTEKREYMYSDCSIKRLWKVESLGHKYWLTVIKKWLFISILWPWVDSHASLTINLNTMQVERGTLNVINYGQNESLASINSSELHGNFCNKAQYARPEIWIFGIMTPKNSIRRS